MGKIVKLNQPFPMLSTIRLVFVRGFILNIFCIRNMLKKKIFYGRS